MKKLMSLMLGLSLLVGATAVFAQDETTKTTKSTTKKAKKGKKTKKETDTTTKKS